jgi:hypothetical protein
VRAATDGLARSTGNTSTAANSTSAANASTHGRASATGPSATASGTGSYGGGIGPTPSGGSGGGGVATAPAAVMPTVATAAAGFGGAPRVRPRRVLYGRARALRAYRRADADVAALLIEKGERDFGSSFALTYQGGCHAKYKCKAAVSQLIINLIDVAAGRTALNIGATRAAASDDKARIAGAGNAVRWSTPRGALHSCGIAVGTSDRHQLCNLALHRDDSAASVSLECLS